MRIGLSERFQHDVLSLGGDRRAAVFEVLLALLRALGEPLRHPGLGLRKLHPSGLWEARVGLGLRLVFAIETDLLTLVRVGTHDEVKRFLRSL